jgi:hypothetical protein
MAYPATIDELTDGVPSDGAAPTTALSDVTFPHDDHHRALGVAVEAVETELGTDPSGSEATVKARIAAVEAAASPTPRRLAPASATHYMVPVTAVDTDAASQTAALAQIGFWWPCYAHRALTVTGFAIYCWTLEVGSTMRFGIYANSGTDLTPGSLVADFGTVAGTTAGEKTVAGSQAISAGYFWVCLWASNNTTVRWNRRTTNTQWTPFGAVTAQGRSYFAYKSGAVDYSAGLPSSPPSLSVCENVTDSNAPLPQWKFT